MPAHRYIYRLKPKSVGDSAVWSVQIDNAAGKLNARFADSRFGGEAEALAAAIACRDKFVGEAGLEGRLQARDSPHPGVSRTESEYNDRGTTRLQAHWQAYWTKPDGSQQTKRFGVRKHGEEGAKQLAIRAREHALEALRRGVDTFFELPPVRAALWRYMDFTKFLAMLEDRALFFSTAENFEDPYEGALASGNVWRRNFVLSKSGNVGPRAPSGPDPRLVINCWYAAKHESAAMWNLYARNTDAIAVRTSVRHLLAALPQQARVGLVKYVDYTKHWIPEHDPVLRYFHKRVSFQHENELRAVIDMNDPAVPLLGQVSENGLKLSVGIEKLIDEVYIGPKSSDWFVDLVAGVCKRYGLEVTPKRSSLYDGPIL